MQDLVSASRACSCTVASWLVPLISESSGPGLSPGVDIVLFLDNTLKHNLMPRLPAMG